MIYSIKKLVLAAVLSVIILVVILLNLRGNELPASDGAPQVSGSSRLSELLGNDGVGGFPLVVAEREFTFPDDHGPHPEYRNEWWYVTGNLDGAGDERFGFELTLFRFSLVPQETPLSDAVSAWKTNQVYIGHFAVSDGRQGEFHVAQRYSRGAAGLAGAAGAPLRIWLDDWELSRGDADGEIWSLRASDTDFALNLELVAAKPPVLNGRNGLSQKSAEDGNASYYYSLTRLESIGTLRIGDDSFEVSGQSWLDREWGSSALSQEQVGWDWFALQLDNGSELMFYNLRRTDGIRDIYSAGTYTNSGGNADYLGSDAVRIEVLDHWENERGDRYPVAWLLEVPGKDLRLEVSPVLKHQELNTSVRYWEGAVDGTGTAFGEKVVGRGYVELTGYAE
jgi:predicted secreted hydrolase